MNRISFCLVVAALVLGASVASAAQSSTAKRANRVAKSDQQIEQLKALVSTQQQQIEQQRAEMDQLKIQFQQLMQATEQANAAAQKSQSATENLQGRAVQAEQTAQAAQQQAVLATGEATEAKSVLAATQANSKEEQRRLQVVENLVGRFRFTGDVRVRGENFFQSYAGCNAAGEAAGKGPLCADRNRVRVRVRFGVEGKLNEDFVGGFALATGSLGDPTTTNETLTNFLDRKTIALDRGYITYNPVSHSWLSLTGGKFSYPWNRTSLTFDPDINPEGFDEKLSWNLTTPVLKSFTAQAMQLILNENNNAQFLSAADSYAVGGQISGVLDFGFMKTTPSVTALNFRNIDAFLNASAFAVQATTTGATGATPAGPFPVSGEGPGCSSGSGLPSFAPCAFAANRLTNATFVGPDGKPHFASQYLYGDIILNNQIKTWSARFPFNLILESEQNLRAAGHPIGSNGKVRTDLGRQSHAYLIDASVGQTKNKGEFQVGYSWWRIEQDAILASFAESDQRAPSNILQNRVYGLFKIAPNTIAGYTLWIGHTLNPNLQHAVLAPGWTTALGANEPSLKRQQFDLIYTF